MLSGPDDPASEEAWRQIENTLCRFERDGTFEGLCELLMAAGSD